MILYLLIAFAAGLFAGMGLMTMIYRNTPSEDEHEQQ